MRKLAFPLACLAVFSLLLTENAYTQAIPVRLSTTFPFITIARNGIGTTSTTGFTLSNSTAAGAGAQQYSPRACFAGNGWKTDATAASQSTVICLEAQPVQGAAAPTVNLIISRSIAGGAFSTIGTLTSASGWTTTTGTFTSTVVSNYLRSNGNSVLYTAVVTITSGFGTTPAIAGIASSFKVTVGTGGDTTGVVAFNTTWSNAPSCIANNETSAQLVRATSTTTAVTLAGTLAEADVIKVVCVGY